MDSRARAAMIRKVEKRVRARYRKRCWLIFLFSIVLGIILGVVVANKGWFGGKDINTYADAQPTATQQALIDADTPTPTPVAVETAAVENTAASTQAPENVQTPPPTEAALAQNVATEAPTTAPQDELAAFFGLSSIFDSTTEAPTSAPTDAPTIAPTDTVAATDPQQTSVPATEVATPTPAVTLIPLTGTDTAQADAQTAQTPVQTDATGTGTKANPVRVGEAYAFETQVLTNGSPRISTTDTAYETVRLSLIMTNYFEPSYFANKYSDRYRFTGKEFGTSIDITLESSTGNVSIIPGSAIQITFENEAGEEIQGYRLMDAEIGGNYELLIAPGETLTVYKRLSCEPESPMDYMVVTYYLDGVAHKVYFLLESVTPPVEYKTLKRGDNSSEVKALQERLIELGYLSDGADGIYGGKTETAVSSVQKIAGMSETGIADQQFQEYIYSANAATAG